MDFGLAHADDLSALLTRTNAVLGTPQYMSPEQAEGRARELDSRTDVYAMGVILYEILAGVPAVPGDVRRGPSITGSSNSDPVPPARMRPGIEPDLQVVCLKAMDRDRDRRYSTALAMAEDLRRWRQGRTHLRASAEPFRLLRRQLIRRRTAIAAGLILLLGAGGTSVVLPMLRNAEERPRPRASRPVQALRSQAEALLAAALPAGARAT